MEATRAAIVERIQQLARAGEPLNISAVRRRHPDFLAMAYEVRPFLGWRGAIEAAGLDPFNVPRQLEAKCVCRECGFAAGMLTAHLQSAHGLSGKQYRQRYPGAEVAGDISLAKRMKPSSVMPHWEPMWTAEYVLDRIHAFHQAGIALNYANVTVVDRALAGMALAEFGSWDAALQKVGIDPGGVRKLAPSKSLNRWDVIDELKSMWRRQEPLNETALKERNLRLLNAARRQFGSYAKALEAAGLDPAKVRLHRHRYTLKEKVAFLDEVKRVAALPAAERPQAVEQLHREHRSFVYASFGNWAKVAKAAGVEIWRILRRGPHAEPAVLEGLRQRCRQGKPLRPLAIFREDRKLYGGILKLYRNFPGLVARLEQLRREGGEPGTSAGYLLDIIRRDMTPAPKPKPPPKPLLRPARRLSTPEEILAELRSRHEQGRSLRTADVKRPNTAGGDVTLYTKARRHFGSWDLALAAAGLDRRAVAPRHRSDRYPDAASVVAQLQKRARLGQGILGRDLKRPESTGGDHQLLHAAVRAFGSLPQACQAAGLDYAEAARRRAGSRKYPSRQAVLQALRERAARGLPLSVSAVINGKKEMQPDLTLYRRAKHFFGSWDAALQAARA